MFVAAWIRGSFAGYLSESVFAGYLSFLTEFVKLNTLHHAGSPFNFAPPGEGLPNCYFCDPGELEPLFHEVQLSVKHFCGTEGVFGGRVSRFHELDTALREEWFDFTVTHCEAPVFRWTSEHLLIVAQRT